MRKPTKLIAVLIILALIVTVGCSAAKKPEPDYAIPNDKMNRPINDGGNNYVAGSNPAETARESENLRRQVESINGVGHAAVVINNTRAIVGVMPSKSYKGSGTTLVNSVEAGIRNNSGNLQETYVTAEPLLYSQIKDIEIKINGGRSPAVFAKDLNNIAENIRTNNNGGKGMEQRQ